MDTRHLAAAMTATIVMGDIGVQMQAVRADGSASARRRSREEFEASEADKMRLHMAEVKRQRRAARKQSCK